jgi:phage tail tape-measure protein
MEHYDDPDLTTRDVETTIDDHETHATTGGAAVAGAVTGGVIGLTGGPVGAVVGAVGGAIVGAAAERMMHSDDVESEPTPAVGTPDTSAPATSDITTTPAASAGDRGSIFVEHDEEDETR